MDDLVEYNEKKTESKERIYRRAQNLHEILSKSKKEVLLYRQSENYKRKDQGLESFLKNKTWGCETGSIVRIFDRLKLQCGCNNRVAIIWRITLFICKISFLNWYQKDDHFINEEIMIGNLDQIISLTTSLERIMEKTSKSRFKFQALTINLLSVECYEELISINGVILVWNEFLALYEMVAREYSQRLFIEASYCFRRNPLKRSIYVLIEMLRDLVRIEGNKGFGVIKNIPEIAVAIFIRGVEGREEFLNTLREKFIRKYNVDADNIIIWLINSDLDHEELLEVVSINKLCSYPYVDEKKSAKNLKKEWESEKVVLYSKINEARTLFVKEFIKGYGLKYGKLPNFSVPGRNRLIDFNLEEVLSREYERLPLEIFEEVEFRHTFQFDYYDDPIELLKDKAIIPNRQSWINEFEKQAYWDKYNKPPPAVLNEGTRFLLHYYTNEIKPRQILEEMDRGILHNRDKIMAVCWKAQEYKVDNCRGFGKLTPNWRIYQTATEANLEKIIELLEGQAMTLSEGSLRRKMYNFGKIQHGREKYITLDFERWNTNMSKGCTEIFFSDFDDLFGLRKLYKMTHDLPRESLFVIVNRYDPPEADLNGDPIEDYTVSFNSSSWLEGLRQKGWTIICLCMIKMAIKNSECSAEILEQGDNVSVKLHTNDSRDDIEDATRRFKINLQNSVEEIGWKLKDEECWDSSFVYEFGKKYYIRGILVKSELKRIAAALINSDQLENNLETKLSNIYSAGIAAAGNGYEPKTPFLVSTFLAVNKIMIELEIDPEETILFILMTRLLGGFNSVNFGSFVIRGIPDPLTAALSVLKTLFTNYPSFWNLFYKIGPIASENLDYSIIIKDPVCLNIELPMRKAAWYRQRLKEVLPEIVKNSFATSVIMAITGNFEEVLLNDLLSANPLDARLSNYIYLQSNMALVDNFIARFTSSKTVQDAFMEAAIGSIAMLIKTEKDQEEKMRLWIKTRREGKRPSNLLHLFEECSSNTAKNLRNTTWRRELINVTFPPVQEQWLAKSISDFSILGTNILVNVDGIKLNCKGKYVPYFGSMTKVKTTTSYLEIVNYNKLAVKLKNILLMMGWTRNNRSPAGSKLLKKLLEEKTLGRIMLDEAIPSVYSGSFMHRLRDSSRKGGAMSNIDNTASEHVNVCMEFLGEFNYSKEDWSLFFQEIILYATSIGVEVSSESKEEIFIFKKGCEGCFFITEENGFKPLVSSYPGLMIEMPIIFDIERTVLGVEIRDPEEEIITIELYMLCKINLSEREDFESIPDFIHLRVYKFVHPIKIFEIMSEVITGLIRMTRSKIAKIIKEIIRFLTITNNIYHSNLVMLLGKRLLDMYINSVYNSKLKDFLFIPAEMGQEERNLIEVRSGRKMIVLKTYGEIREEYNKLVLEEPYKLIFQIPLCEGSVIETNKVEFNRPFIVEFYKGLYLGLCDESISAIMTISLYGNEIRKKMKKCSLIIVDASVEIVWIGTLLTLVRLPIVLTFKKIERKDLRLLKIKRLCNIFPRLVEIDLSIRVALDFVKVEDLKKYLLIEENDESSIKIMYVRKTEKKKTKLYELVLPCWNRVYINFFGTEEESSIVHEDIIDISSRDFQKIILQIINPVFINLENYWNNYIKFVNVNVGSLISMLRKSLYEVKKLDYDQMEHTIRPDFVERRKFLLEHMKEIGEIIIILDCLANNKKHVILLDNSVIIHLHRGIEGLIVCWKNPDTCLLSTYLKLEVKMSNVLDYLINMGDLEYNSEYIKGQIGVVNYTLDVQPVSRRLIYDTSIDQRHLDSNIHLEVQHETINYSFVDNYTLLRTTYEY